MRVSKTVRAKNREIGAQLMFHCSVVVGGGGFFLNLHDLFPGIGNYKPQQTTVVHHRQGGESVPHDLD